MDDLDKINALSYGIPLLGKRPLVAFATGAEAPPKEQRSAAQRADALGRRTGMQNDGSCLLVIDYDDSTTQYPFLPDTWTVRTKSGLHAYYLISPDRLGCFNGSRYDGPSGPVDLRCHNQYVKLYAEPDAPRDLATLSNDQVDRVLATKQLPAWRARGQKLYDVEPEIVTSRRVPYLLSHYRRALFLYGDEHRARAHTLEINERLPSPITDETSPNLRDLERGMTNYGKEYVNAFD